MKKSILFCILAMFVGLGATQAQGTQTPTLSEQLEQQNQELQQKLDAQNQALQQKIEEQNQELQKKLSEQTTTAAPMNFDNLSENVAKNVQKRLDETRREEEWKHQNMRKLARAAVYGGIAILFAVFSFVKKRKSARKK